MKRTIPVFEAKAKLSKLIERALSGELIIISRGNVPVVKLTPIARSSGRRFGAMKGRARVTEDFFSPLSEAELAAWD